MILEGDGPEGQPTETVDSIDDIANALIGENEPAEDEAEGGEASEESEGSEEDADDDSGGEEEEEEEPAKKKFTIKHDGKDVDLELTPDEEIENHQKAFDYTRKTMAVAEDRKVSKADREDAAQYRLQSEQVLGEQLSRLQALEQFSRAHLGDPPPISLAQQDAHAFLVQKEMYESRVGTLQQIQAAIQHTENDAQQQRQARISRQAEETDRALRDTLPGWNDDMLNDYAKYAAGLGLTAQTAEGAIVQKGFWELVHKAKAFDALQAKKAELKPKEKLTKVVKPSAQNQSGKAIDRAKRDAAFNKNPSVDALAELLMR